MDIIDEEGRILGFINIIDVMVVLLILAVLIAGLVLVFGNTDTDTDTVAVSVTVEEIQPSVAEAIETGNISEDVTITEKSVSPSEVVVRDSEGELHVREHPTLKTVNLRAELRVERDQEGLQFRGESLRIGSQITLESERVRVTGNITEIQE